MNKEPFLFKYTRPFSDWYETIQVTINPDDYHYFKLELRSEFSWWLIGTNPKETPNYHWEETQIGEINAGDLKRFIDWATQESGSKIIQVRAISGEYNIIEEIQKIVK